jgi:hypothetical protein
MAFDSGHGQVVLFGGYDGAAVNDTWLFYRSPFANWVQEAPATSPPPRYYHAMAYDSAHGQVVLFGGYSGSAYLADTWVWNGATWTKKSPVTSPTARLGHAMAYDSVHQQVVLFGGSVNGTVAADTWVWDGTNWTLKTPASSPTARDYHAMAYDSTREQVVLFGGSDGNISDNPYGDTWVWDGTTWTEKSTSGPPGRYAEAMAYDVLHSQVVLFGGLTHNSYANDTWVWNGTNWTQKSPATSPAARVATSMVDDVVHGEVVLYGGFCNGCGDYGDTWLWNGTNWTQELTTPNPPARQLPAMAFDIAHQQAVLFGGFTYTGLNDTWLWEGGFSVSPNSGSGAGTSASPLVFNATYYDTSGASDLQAVYLDFGSVGDSPNSCKIGYAQANNTLYLFNDANTGTVGSVVLGGGGSVSNSQCTLYGGSTPATLFGINLTVPFQIQFLAGFGGQKTIFGVAQTYDGTFSNGGAFEPLGTWTTNPSTPSAVSVNPSSGSGLGPTSFNATYSDTGGANDLDIVYLDFGSVGTASTINLAAENNCIVLYTPASNNLYLFTDNNSTAVGPITLGSGMGTLSNSQCTVSSGSTPATPSGNSLTVPFNITFKSGYGGLKSIFGLAITYAGTSSNGGLWLPIGTWTPAASTPSVVSVAPINGAGAGTAGTPLVFTAKFSDTGGANDLQVVYLTFGPALNAAHSCAVGYQPGNNSLELYNDAGTSAATVGEGLGGSVSNSQCTLYGGSTAATLSGTTLTVPFSIVFNPGFTALQTVWGFAQTYAGTFSNGGTPTNLGSWTP